MRYTLLALLCVGCDDKNSNGDGGTEPTSSPPEAGSDTVSLLEVWSLSAQPGYATYSQVGGMRDVNGDGFDDVIVALYGTPSRTELYLGSPEALGTIPAWTDERTGDNALGSPAAAGDVNGDGFGDVLFGSAWFADGPGGSVGRAAAFYGSASGLPDVADWKAIGQPNGAHYSGLVCAAGDVNGDGFGDVLVSDIDSFGDLTEGKVYGFLGSADGLEDVPSWTVHGDVGAMFGHSIAGAGDVNGDGYDDVVIGAPASADVRGGRAYVFLGSPSGLEVAPRWVGRGDESLSTTTGYGYQVAGAGDVNGDGYADLLVGAPFTVGTAGSQGRAHVVLGSPTGPVESTWDATIRQDGALYGFTLAGAGDLNGDGFHDLAIGAPYFDDVEGDEGRVEVYLGSSTGVRERRAWVAGSDTESDLYGAALGSAGDVNGDGFDDLLVGALGYDNLGGSPGRVWAYTGGDVEE